MATPNQEYSRRESTEFLPRRNYNNVWSILAIALSTLSLLLSGFTLAQMLTLQRAINALENSVNRLSASPQPTTAVVPSPSAIPIPPPASPYSTQPPATPSVADVAIQPGQFVKSALRNKAQIELLRVNRIPNQRDVVNVQMRIRAPRPQVATGSDAIYLGSTTARNPQTSETYEAVAGESTGTVSLFSMRQENQPSVDAYVWLQVPQEVGVIDIYIPNTEAFTNVPISN